MLQTEWQLSTVGQNKWFRNLKRCFPQDSTTQVVEMLSNASIVVFLWNTGHAQTDQTWNTGNIHLIANFLSWLVITNSKHWQITLIVDTSIAQFTEKHVIGRNLKKLCTKIRLSLNTSTTIISQGLNITKGYNKNNDEAVNVSFTKNSTICWFKVIIIFLKKSVKF